MILNYKSSKFKYLIDDIAINFLSFESFVGMENIKRKCNQIVDLSKFISNKKILNEIVTLGSTKFVAKLCIKINMTIYFKNLTVELHILYILNKYVKYFTNWILFKLRPINYYLCIFLDYKNSKFKHFIDNIAINYLFFLKSYMHGLWI